MLGSIFKDCYALRQEMVDIYWILLTPVTVGTMILEFYKQTLNFGEILKRVVISITFVLGFEYITEIIASVSNGIIERIGGIERTCRCTRLYPQIISRKVIYINFF